MTDASPQDTLDILLARCREVRTPCGDGQLLWRIWGAPERPAVVLLHGGFGAWNHWVRNIPALEADFRVIVADLPGCGDSNDPPSPYDAPSLAAILSDGLDHLFAKDNTSFDLVAFSFGGILSGLTGTGKANDLVAVPPDMPADEAAPVYRSNLEKLMVHDPAAVDDLAMTLHVANMGKTRLRSRKIARTFVTADTLVDLPCRLNFVFGDGDPTLHPDMEGIRAHVAALQPEAPFHVFPDTGHWVQYEAADRFNALLPELLSAGK